MYLQCCMELKGSSVQVLSGKCIQPLQERHDSHYIFLQSEEKAHQQCVQHSSVGVDQLGMVVAHSKHLLNLNEQTC